MNNVRIIPYPNNGGPNPDGDAPRVESGAVQFGSDWKGLFLRGDDAMAISMNIDSIENFLNSIPDELKVEVGGVDLALAFISLQNLRETIIKDVINQNENSN
jgi:hypothetical protein